MGLRRRQPHSTASILQKALNVLSQYASSPASTEPRQVSQATQIRYINRRIQTEPVVSSFLDVCNLPNLKSSNVAEAQTLFTNIPQPLAVTHITTASECPPSGTNKFVQTSSSFRKTRNKSLSSSTSSSSIQLPRDNSYSQSYLLSHHHHDCVQQFSDRTRALTKFTQSPGDSSISVQSQTNVSSFDAVKNIVAHFSFTVSLPQEVVTKLNRSCQSNLHCQFQDSSHSSSAHQTVDSFSTLNSTPLDTSLKESISSLTSTVTDDISVGTPLRLDQLLQIPLSFDKDVSSASTTSSDFHSNHKLRLSHFCPLSAASKDKSPGVNRFTQTSLSRPRSPRQLPAVVSVTSTPRPPHSHHSTATFSKKVGKPNRDSAGFVIRELSLPHAFLKVQPQASKSSVSSVLPMCIKSQFRKPNLIPALTIKGEPEKSKSHVTPALTIKGEPEVGKSHFTPALTIRGEPKVNKSHVTSIKINKKELKVSELLRLAAPREQTKQQVNRPHLRPALKHNFKGSSKTKMCSMNPRTRRLRLPSANRPTCLEPPTFLKIIKKPLASAKIFLSYSSLPGISNSVHNDERAEGDRGYSVRPEGRTEGDQGHPEGRMEGDRGYSVRPEGRTEGDQDRSIHVKGRVDGEQAHSILPEARVDGDRGLHSSSAFFERADSTLERSQTNFSLPVVDGLHDVTNNQPNLPERYVLSGSFVGHVLAPRLSLSADTRFINQYCQTEPFDPTPPPAAPVPCCPPIKLFVCCQGIPFQHHQLPSQSHQSSFQSHDLPSQNHQSSFHSHELISLRNQSSFQSHQSSYQSHQLPSQNNQSPSQNRQSPSLNRQSPSLNRQSPCPNCQSPSLNRQSPCPNCQSPSLKRQSSSQDSQSPCLDRQSPCLDHHLRFKSHKLSALNDQEESVDELFYPHSVQKCIHRSSESIALPDNAYGLTDKCPGSSRFGLISQNDEIKSRPPSITCYICGREYGTYSSRIHEKHCITQWVSENEALPPELQRPMPVRPDITVETACTGTDSETSYYDYDEINAAAVTALQSQYIPCQFCCRTFLPDSLLVHAKSCNKYSKIRRIFCKQKRGN